MFPVLHFKFHRNIKIMLSLLSLKKIAKKKKIKRISHEALEELRFYLEQEALEIARESLELAKFAKRHTVMKEDVELAIKRRNKKAR